MMNLKKVNHNIKYVVKELTHYMKVQEKVIEKVREGDECLWICILNEKMKE